MTVNIELDIDPKIWEQFSRLAQSGDANHYASTTEQLVVQLIEEFCADVPTIQPGR